MTPQSLAASLFLTLTLFPRGVELYASPFPQTRHSKSEADINAIGHRHVGEGPNIYSLEQEKKLGKWESEEIERSSKLLKDPLVVDYVDRIAQNVAKNSDARMTVIVGLIDTDEVEAFTLAGGYQYLSRGLLLRLEGEGELASILARGIAHTALRTATKEATKADVTQLGMISFAIGGLGPGGRSSTLPLSQMKFRQDLESDADYFGVQYIYKSGYSPQCFTDLVQLVWGSAGSATRNKVPDSLSEFPPLDKRLAVLQKEVSKILPPRADAITTTPEFAAFKEHLRTQNLALFGNARIDFVSSRPSLVMR